MKDTIYISPDTEDYTGYTTYVLMGTSTSELGIFPLPVEELPGAKEERVDEYIFPETREERFLDKDLVEFYRKKGYETQK